MQPLMFAGLQTSMADDQTVFVLMTLTSLLRLLHQNVDLLKHNCDQQSHVAVRALLSVCLCHCHLVCSGTGFSAPLTTGLACTLHYSVLICSCKHKDTKEGLTILVVPVYNVALVAGHLYQGTLSAAARQKKTCSTF